MNTFKINLLLAFVLLSNLFYSQQTEKKHIQLEWQDNVEFAINKDVTIKTILIKGNYVDENLNPTFHKTWPVPFGVRVNKFFVKNVIYETVSNLTNYRLDRNKLSSNLEADFKIVHSRNKSFANLTLNPIIKDGPLLTRVKSFELEYSLTSNKKNQKAKSHTIKNSVLATGDWYKFSVDTTGVYKLDFKFLQSLGIDVNSINPKQIQIFGNGGEMLPFKNSDFRFDGLQENSIFISGEEDGSFDSNDFILFYAKGPHSWKNTKSGNLNELEHQFNIFSDEAYYFITIEQNEGKRIKNKTPITSSLSEQISIFHDYTFLEKDEVNILAAGQQWFGDSFNIQNIHTYSIPFKNIDNSENVIVKLRGVTQSTIPTQMEVKVNHQNLFNVNFPAYSGLSKAVVTQNSAAVQLNGNSINVEVSYNNNGNPSAKAYLDYIEVIGAKKLIAEGKQFSFRNFYVNKTAQIFEYKLENNENIYKVWDISNPLNVSNITNESNLSNFLFKVQGGIFNEYIVLNEQDFYTPQKLEQSIVKNQNLHALKDIDYLIVTQDFLTDQAQRLANYHENNSNFKVAVVPLNEIYNEFSSGTQDISAIRDFVKHLYDNATSNKIKYLCLFGDASFDYKNRIGGNNNIVPVFEAYESFNLASSFVTDDFYGMMNYNEGEMYSFERQDVVTGRIPVSDHLEAEVVVDKILNYYSSKSFGDWRSYITLIADDIDSSGEDILQKEMEKIADTISVKKPVFNLKKIYLDSYVQQSTSGGNKYPDVNTEITNQIEKGTLLVNYFGHGGEDGWASESVLGVSDIQKWENKYKLPLFITVTCEFSRFDNPLRKTAGEFVFLKENGGASMLISTTRQIFISVGQALNERLVKPLLNFNDENYSFAESLMHVKNQFSTNQRYFVYAIGDPAMKLSIPKANIKITKMNDIDITQKLDTIRALGYMKLEGEIINSNGALVNDFNGELEVTVFDKAIHKKTLNNDRRGGIMNFDVQESKIFTGRSKVTNGVFNVDFVAPKDLKIAYGKGKLSFYASNELIDRAGNNSEIIIGGINNNAPEDTTGPIVQTYMNDLNFVEGGNTNESPLFIAVLEDENGINTSITAVDHDIVAILDGDQSNPIILNDFYKTEIDNYKKGTVKYPFKNLVAGNHTIDLKVWDTHNNLTESTFSFVVIDNSDLILSNVLNYPNPFINYTEFWFNHNKPNELLDVQIQIFTVSGKLVKTLNETVQSEGNLSKSLVWDGLDDFGAKIGKGVYLYRLKVKAVNSNVSAEKIEKLVILQ